MNIGWAVRGPEISIRNFLGVEKKKFNSRAPTGRQKWSAASMESCRFVAQRPPGSRLGSILDMGNCLQRMRGRFHRYMHISTCPQPDIGPEPKSPKFWIQSSLESPKNWRMRSRRLPDPRPIPEVVREPICIQKK